MDVYIYHKMMLNYVDIFGTIAVICWDFLFVLQFLYLLNYGKYFSVNNVLPLALHLLQIN